MRFVMCAILVVVAGACANDLQVTQPRAAYSRPVATTRYVVVKLLRLGPTGTTQGGGINNRGWVAGFAGLTGGIRHAALWRDTSITDLGTLGGVVPGLHSNVQWPGISNTGMVVGISHTAELDTLGETWSCAAFMAANGHVCLGFVWQSGVMSALPTLGGENGFAAGVNSRGQVVGWAENRVHDPTCTSPQVLQFRAVVWEPATGRQRELRPYPGDSTSAATAINENGQAVGISGECDVAVGRRSAIRAVLWEGDAIIDLGNLGGDFWHTPMAINDRGDVVGFSNPPGGDLDANDIHAFLWTRSGGMKDLGLLDGDGFSQALGINTRGQVVGVSCLNVCQAVLWQDGERYRLQDLVEPGFADHLWSARSINDAGVVTGRLVEQGTGRTFAYIATPVAPAP